MKKYAAIFMVTLLLLGTTACDGNTDNAKTGQANADPVAMQSISMAGDAPSLFYTLAHEGERVWAYTGENIYSIDIANADAPVELPMAIENGSFMSGFDTAAGGETMYTVASVFESILVEGEAPSADGFDYADRQYIIAFAPNGEILNRYRIDLPVNEYIMRLVVDNETAYMFSNNSQSVYAADIPTGTVQKLDLPRVRAMSKQDGGLFLITDSPDGAVFCTYSFAEAAITQEYTFEIAFDTVSRTSNVVDNQVYFSSANIVYRASLTDETYEYLYTCPTSVYSGITDISADANRLFLILSTGKLMAFDNVMGKWDSGESLRVMGFFNESAFFMGASRMALVQLSERHMNLNIEYAPAVGWDMYESNLLKKLMAKDSDLDVFWIDESLINVVQKDYFEDLSAYPAIKANMAQTLPGVQGLMSLDERIFGVPINFMPKVKSYRPSQAEKYQIAPATTLQGIVRYKESFAHATEAFTSEKPPLGISAFDFLNPFYAGFFTKEREITENDVYLFLGEMKQLIDEGYVDADIYSMSGALFDTTFQINFDPNTAYMPNASFDTGASYPVGYSALCVNPYSDNKELAIEFMELLSAPQTERMYVEDVIQSTMQMHSHEHNHAEDDTTSEAAMTAHEEDLKRMALEGTVFYPLFEQPHLAGNSNYELYKKILANSTKEYEPGSIRLDFIDIFELFSQGKITQEDAAARFYAKMRMMRDE